MTEWHALGAAATARAVRARQVTALQVTEAVLARIEALNCGLGCFTAVLHDRALGEARAVDQALADGHDPGLLAGVPFGVKNLFDVAGLTTLAGSTINCDLPPAPRDAALVGRLSDAGAILVGTQAMDEYAYGFTTENAHYGTVHNPHDRARIAGGSSGGSAAAVAAGLGALALGSDTNGSIRVPASFCGLFGLKPTYGRLPRTGTYPFVYDLDHLGALARHAEDLALAYDVLQGHDTGDAACSLRAPQPVTPSLAAMPADLRVGVLGGWFDTMSTEPARDAVAQVADALAARRGASLSLAEPARAAAFLITAASGADVHRNDLRERAAEFDPGTRDRLLAGALLPAAIILQAQRVRRLAYQQAMQLFESFDLLLAACAPCPATLIGQPTLELAGKSLPTRPSIGVLTQPVSCIGLPVVAVPVRRPGALPIGVQLIAPPWHEARVLQVAAWLEARGVVGSGALPI